MKSSAVWFLSIFIAAATPCRLSDEAIKLIAANFVDRNIWPEQKLREKFHRIKRLRRSDTFALRGLVKCLDRNMDYFSSEDISDFRSEVLGAEGGSVLFLEHTAPSLKDFEEIKLVEFTSTTANDLRAGILRRCCRQKGHPRGVLLDLRGNGGGQVRAAVGVASLFLPPGSTVALVSSSNKELSELVTPDSGLCGMLFRRPSRTILRSLPIVIVVDRHTASAAEILAGSLKDHCRATIVSCDSGRRPRFGRHRTYGKGTIQTPLALSDGSALLITTHRFFTPLGFPVDKHGIKSDSVVKSWQDLQSIALPQQVRFHEIEEGGMSSYG